jgi:hypothetical protein
LFLLIALFLGLSVLIREARNPNYYRWLEQLNTQQQEARSADRPSRKRDPGTPPTSASQLARSTTTPTTPVERFDDSSTQVQDSGTGAGSEGSLATNGDMADHGRDACYVCNRGTEIMSDDQFVQLWHDAWQYVFSGLSAEDANLLGECCLRQRHGRPSETSWALTVPPVLDQIDQSLEKYLTVARQTLEVPKEESSAWQQRFHCLEQTWRHLLRPTLQNWLDTTDSVLSAEYQTWLGHWLTVLDAKLAADVRDAAFFSNQETAYWLRCWETALQARAARPELSTVRVMDLVTHPQQYRGALVRLEGEARRVKRVVSPSNPLDIKAYDVVWMRCEGTSQPVAIYFRQLPESFARRLPLGAANDVSIPLTVEGVFFKLLAYRSVRGVDVAPVLLGVTAEVPIGEPAPATTEQAVLGVKELLGIIVLSVLVALGVSVCVWRWTRRRPDVENVP